MILDAILRDPGRLTDLELSGAPELLPGEAGRRR